MNPKNLVMSTYRKRIPYGMMNFVDVRKDDCAQDCGGVSGNGHGGL